MFTSKKRKSAQANDKLQKDVDCLKDSVSKILTRLDKVELVTATPISKTDQDDKFDKVLKRGCKDCESCSSCELSNCPRK